MPSTPKWPDSHDVAAAEKSGAGLNGLNGEALARAQPVGGDAVDGGGRVRGDSAVPATLLSVVESLKGPAERVQLGVEYLLVAA